MIGIGDGLEGTGGPIAPNGLAPQMWKGGELELYLYPSAGGFKAINRGKGYAPGR